MATDTNTETALEKSRKIKALAGFIILLNATANGGYFRSEDLPIVVDWLYLQPVEPEDAYFAQVKAWVENRRITLLKLVYDGRNFGLGAPELDIEPEQDDIPFSF